MQASSLSPSRISTMVPLVAPMEGERDVVRHFIDQLVASQSSDSGGYIGRKLADRLEKIIEPLPRGVEDTGARGALSSGVAGMCVLDTFRSKQYVRAIRQAIRDMLLRDPFREIHVLDAGCGPYAFLSLVAAIESPLVRVTALDTNQASVVYARHVVEQLGLSKQISVARADCITARLPEKPDIIVTETFDSGLFREYGYQILQNLSRQGHADSITIPHAVNVIVRMTTHHDASGIQVACCGNVFSYHAGDKQHRRRGVVLDHEKLRPGSYFVELGTALSLYPEIDIVFNAHSAITVPGKVCGLRVRKPLNRMAVTLYPGEGRFDVFADPLEAIELVLKPSKGAFECRLLDYAEYRGR